MTDLAVAKRVLTTSGEGDTLAVAGVGFRPGAVITWWSCQAGEGAASGNRGGFGFWTEERSAAIAWASDDHVVPTSACHVADSAALLGLEGGDGRVSMRAEVSRFDSDGVLLRWTTRPTDTWTIHVVALGGPALTRADVGWLDETGPDGSSGLGLEGSPDLIFFGSTRARARGAPSRGLSIGFGTASRDGQAAATYTSRDGAPAGEVAGAQRTDASLLLVKAADALEAMGVVRFDVERAPTADWIAGSASPGQVCFLSLEGMAVEVGAAVSPSRPASRRTRVGFRPDALVFFTWGSPASASPTDIGRLCIGAATAEAMGCTSWDDRDWQAIPAQTHVHSSTRDVVIVPNTQTGGIHASATLASIGRRGFTLDWTASDGKARQVLWVAVGGAGAGRRPRRSRYGRSLLRRS